MKRLGAVALSLGLAACAATPQERQALASEVPSNYREIVAVHIKAALKDPYSVREARISEPTSVFVGLVNGGNVPGVCVSFNAKNAMGGYVGKKVYSVAFNGTSVMTIHEPINTTCQGETWSDYPEIEGGGSPS